MAFSRSRHNEERLYPRLSMESQLTTKKSLEVGEQLPAGTPVYRTEKERGPWWRLPIEWAASLFRRIRLLIISPKETRYKGLPYVRPGVRSTAEGNKSAFIREEAAPVQDAPASRAERRESQAKTADKTARPRKKPGTQAHKRYAQVGAAVGALAVIGLGYYLFIGRYCTVTVNDNGQISDVRTKEKTVSEMLNKAGYTLEQEDILTVPGSAAPFSGMQIGIRRAHERQIEDNGSAVSVRLGPGTVGDALTKAGIELGKDDEVQPAINTPFAAAESIRVLRAKTLTVSTKKGEKTVQIASGTVGDALTKAGVSWDKYDKISPSADTAIEDGMKITFVSAEKKTVTKKYSVAYSTVKKNSSSLTINQTKVSQNGVNGVRTVKEEVTYHDGVEVSRKVISDTVTKKPVDKIILVGTKPSSNPKVANLPKNGPTESMIAKTITADQITAYTWTGKRTATGKWPTRGMCAVNRSVIPYGTVLYIPGYGYAVAEDTGSGKGDLVYSIDVYMDTRNECLQWGRKRNVKVYILK